MISNSKKILQERALLLAKENVSDNECSGHCTTMLQVDLSNRKYAIESSYIKEIVTVDTIIPIPGTGKIIHGIVNVRGKIIVIINLWFLFDIERKRELQNRVIVLRDETKGLEFGFMVDEINATLPLKHDEIKALPANLNGQARKLLTGITETGLITVNTMQLIEIAYAYATKTNEQEEKS